VGREEAVVTLLQTLEPLDSDAAQVMLSMAYDVSYGISDHYDPEKSKPLDTITLHAREDYKEVSGMYRAIERYNRQGIGNLFHLSLTDYLNLPKDIIEMITEIVIESAKRIDAITSKEPTGGPYDGKRGSW
jgi:hypothetical protein